MQRFYFNISDGRDFEDDEGTLLPGVEAAREEASRILAAHLKDHPAEPWREGELTVTVQDEHRLILFVMTVTGRAAAAVSAGGSGAERCTT